MDNLKGISAVAFSAAAIGLWISGSDDVKKPLAAPLKDPAGDLTNRKTLPTHQTGVRSIFGLLKRTYAEFAEDRIPAVAGGITFFVLLALFPAIASVVSLYGLIGQRRDTADQLTHLGGFLPGGAVSVLGDELHRLTTQKPAELGTGFLIGLGIALWSSSGGIKALVDGLNIAYEVRETRSFIRLTLLALLFTAIAVMFMIVAVGLSTIVPSLIQALPLSDVTQTLLNILCWPLGYLACALLLAVVYRFAPARGSVKWQWITWGSGIASALWIGGTALFSWYVQNYGSYNRTYGALGSAVGFLTWIWLSLVILLSGAELNRELERKSE